MSNFIEEFKLKGDISFLGMRDTALSLLPKDRLVQDRLYENLRRGIEILDDDDHLNMYLNSFGKMHKAKLNEAFDCFSKITEIFAEDVEIYDWGCGQGTATICLLDYLKEKHVTPHISGINLIDPSDIAVKRATDVIKCYNKDFPINKIVKLFDDLNPKDFPVTEGKKLHLFSNILDVDAFDLARFIHVFQQSFRGENIFVCVGPYYGNTYRVDEFITAIVPDTMFVTADKERGNWEGEWTISLRIFIKEIQSSESTDTIRKRIDDAKKERQFFAGYILDAISEEFKTSDIADETETLYRALSSFDVKSNISLEHKNISDSKLAVLANIISRGLPTKAPILVENIFSDKFEVSEKPLKDAILNYVSKHKLSSKTINEALHIIDPRFDINFYDESKLESSFEKKFIKDWLKETGYQYMVQLLEPQRQLSTIVDFHKNTKTFTKDQRVDFSFEVPYGDTKTGFIIELDGKQYHSTIFQRLRDKRRDRLAERNSWDTRRIKKLKDISFLNSWHEDPSIGKYLNIIKKNNSKQLTGKWNQTLQIVLSPIAIARVERMLIEAMMSGALSTTAKEWNIIVVERDVPCSAIAIEVLKEKYEHLCALAGIPQMLPKINLNIVSTKEFISSPLHMEQKVMMKFPKQHFDLCMDISMLLRCNIDLLPLTGIIDASTFYIIRSSHYKKGERTICVANNIQYPPLVNKDNDKYEIIKERENILEYFLRDIFRKPNFFTGQLPILSRTLSDKTTIGLLPTGGGKSLAYQLSCMLQPGVAIVVDPLISLMEDQVRSLLDIRIDTCDRINSGMDAQEKLNKLNLMQKGALMFMFLSPERFMMKNFRENLISMFEQNNICFSYGIIDEVHCVSEWGHDFRTSYLHLGRNMTTFMRTKSERDISIIGLTATASFDVLADVERELTLRSSLSINSETIVRPEDDSRHELTYRIISVKSNFDELKDSNEPYILNLNDERGLNKVVAKTKKLRLLQLLEEIPSDLENINDKLKKDKKEFALENLSIEKFYFPDDKNKYKNAGIVFCPHAKGSFGVLDNDWGTNGIAYTLRASMPEVGIGTFVGGDNPIGSMKAFNENNISLMVATKAFGMGIDKPNIRFAINVNHPSSLEGYVQEAGRAGRDKKNAISYILYEPTEFVKLSADIISDIRKYIGQEETLWLENYNNKYILIDDIPQLCERNAAMDQSNKILHFLYTKECIKNVDKDIDLWFHNNSFKGLEKEKEILYEMTNHILNAKPTNALKVQNELREITNNADLKLKVDPKKGSITIVSEKDTSMQYGYIFLDNLYPKYNYIDFDENLCRYIANKLIEILKTYQEHSAKFLLKPLDDVDSTTIGIYKTLEGVDKDGYAYITVSWENQIKQDSDAFKRTIREQITKIANEKGWRDIDENNHRKFNIDTIENFDDLLSKIEYNSGDISWVRFHDDLALKPLKRKFYQKRDKEDTDKAIYRMCCVGLVEDVTIDYLSETYELKIRKRSDEEYRQSMLEFFSKYYSREEAEKRIEEIKIQEGRNYIDQCMGYLAGFVYENLERKRYRAIEDMRFACEGSITDRRKNNNDEWLKEFIHLYFNSKYARSSYKVGDEDYSLKDDTDRDGKDGYDIVEKYIDIMMKDPTGSEVDNVKHLYGATLLCLRAHPDNAALLLLHTYCISFLGVGSNENLKNDAFNHYVEGFMTIYQKNEDDVWNYIHIFNKHLKKKAKEKDYVNNHIISEGIRHIMMYIHEEKFNDITQKYLRT